MASRTRTIRLDLSSTLYDPLEHYAHVLDVGVPDMLRRIVVAWANEHPVPDNDEADS